MPTTYAHWYFGQQCLEVMPNGLKAIVNKHRSLYDLGVHGPDIFFYSLNDSSIAKYGSNMHIESGKNIFTLFKSKLNKKDDNYEGKLSYVLGFLTHFIFDSTAHSYVERKRKYENISHNKVEAEYDRHLIELYNHRTFNRAKLIKTNKDTIKVLTAFYPYDENTVKSFLRLQKMILNFIHANTEVKRKFVRIIAEKINKPEYGDLVMGAKECPVCADSNVRIDKLRQNALTIFPKLLDNLMNYLDNKEELVSYFENNFEARENFESIPVYDYKQELEYIVKPEII